LNFDTPDTLAVGTGYVAVVAERLATSCFALVTPAGVALPLAELPPPDEAEPPLEPHPANVTTDAAINAAHDVTHPRPPPGPTPLVSLIARASITLRSTTVA
jgi:hypothetical protein